MLSDHRGNTFRSSPQLRSSQSLDVIRAELKKETSLSNRRLDVREEEEREREGRGERDTENRKDVILPRKFSAAINSDNIRSKQRLIC